MNLCAYYVVAAFHIRECRGLAAVPVVVVVENLFNLTNTDDHHKQHVPACLLDPCTVQEK